MLPILLTILKITGIVILALLGLVLLILLAVLLVPVRYSVSGSYYGRPRGKLKVTWLLRAVSVSITYEDRLDVVLRILGKGLFQGKKAQEDSVRAFDPDKGTPEVDFVESPREEQQEEEQKDDGSGHGEEGAGEDIRTRQQEETGADDSIRFYGAAELPEDEPDDLEDLEDLKDHWSRDQGGSPKGRKRPKGGKLKGLAESVKEKWARFEEYRIKAVSFWNDDRNQKTVKLILRQVKGIIRHILPRKVQGKAVFGFDDPGTTGKVLAGLSMVYVQYGDKIEIVPVFDRKILEAEGSLKGRVQAGVVAARCVRVLLNKNFRRLAWSLIRSGGSRHGRD